MKRKCYYCRNDPGSNSTCPSCIKPTVQDFSAYKWDGTYDEVTKDRVYWLGPFREFTNVSGHGIQVYASVEPIDKFPGARRVTRFTIAIACGPYGETACQQKLPRVLNGKVVNLARAKREAVLLAEKQTAHNNGGYEFKE